MSIRSTGLVFARLVLRPSLMIYLMVYGGFSLEAQVEEIFQTPANYASVRALVHPEDIITLATLRAYKHSGVQVAPSSATKQSPMPPRHFRSVAPACGHVHTNPEVQPEFAGGMEALQKYIAHRQYIHPYTDALDLTRGRVVLEFVVERHGGISSIRVLRRCDPVFDLDAIRLVLLMPRWRPARVGGKAVRARFILPIRHRLQ